MSLSTNRDSLSFQTDLPVKVFSTPSLDHLVGQKGVTGGVPSPLQELRIYKTFEHNLLSLPVPVLISGDSLDFNTAALLSFLVRFSLIFLLHSYFHLWFMVLGCFASNSQGSDSCGGWKTSPSTL